LQCLRSAFSHHLAMPTSVHVDTVHSLLQAFQGLVGNSHGSDHVSHFQGQDFEHGGQNVRGLSTSVDLSAGETLVTVPRYMRPPTAEQLREDPRFQSVAFSPHGAVTVPLGLWLAEKKVQIREQLADQHGLDATEKYWEAYLRSLPSPKELRDAGIPMLAPKMDLLQLSGRPIVGALHLDALQMRQQVAIGLKRYNALRGFHPALDYDDVLWGTAVAGSRGFNCGGTSLVPMADMMNHASSSASNGNWSCSDQDGVATLQALRPISAGEELTWSYHPDNDSPVSTLSQYGFFDAAQARAMKWPALECGELRAAKLGKFAGSGAMLQKVGELVDASCPEDVANEAAESGVAGMPQVAQASGPDILTAFFATEAPAIFQMAPAKLAVRITRSQPLVAMLSACSGRRSRKVSRATHSSQGQPRGGVVSHEAFL